MCKWGTDKNVNLCKPKTFSKRTEVPIDACIAPLVQALNDFGIETMGSCCGHGAEETSIIWIDPKHLELKPLRLDNDDCQCPEAVIVAGLKFPYKKAEGKGVKT